ncbi:RNA polymerase sigma factor [Chlorella sorokiniana]|uniref:RNA polymerase sigma factor n=1 Tax=Chlorella sorokiniana TaxID=3076 RepID=A0A2P6TQV1_CHLSO|nr:RNA polymerase sigma factor [Chlorella sorokiniana]|eukprot:PRW56440.1 RNA polymerase sigma factor [Chlorella sorokiniana]
MPCGPLPTASLCGRWAAAPGLPAIQRVAAAPARSGSIACRAAAAAPPAPDRAAATERPQAAGGALPSTSVSLGTHSAPDSWLAYSWQLRRNPPGITDIVLERLRRQLGWGGRWAWALEDDAEGDDHDEQELDWEAAESEAEAEAEAGPSSSTGSSTQRPIVRSSRRVGQRSGVRRRCRGQALMGAAAYDTQRPWSSAAADGLPDKLQGCYSGQLLTAEQEAWLGELVQARRAAQRAQQQQQQQAAPASGGSSSSTALWRSRGSGPAEPLELAMRRGAAAQQLLFDANVRLVTMARCKLLGSGRFLPPELLQELDNAGRDALWLAAAGFQPGRGNRFSSYAVSAVQNKMRNVLRHRGEVGMHVPKEVHPWRARVRAAARHLQLAEQQQRQQQLTSGQQQQEQQQEEQQEKAGMTPFEQLAAAAHLTQRQVQLGLAGSRRQRLASLGCLVAAEAVEGAGGRRSNRSDQLARFGDVPQQEQQEQEEAELAAAAAREAVQLLLSRLSSSRHADVLRLRHRLDDTCGIPEQRELDFTAVGRQLGVSRQRAQVLYRAAVDAARQQAAALGMC